MKGWKIFWEEKDGEAVGVGYEVGPWGAKGVMREAIKGVEGVTGEYGVIEDPKIHENKRILTVL